MRQTIRFVAVLSIAVLAWLEPASASAQCAEGRVVSEATAGRCCWPGQQWNDTAGRCEGPPQCPSGWAGEGDSCVRASASGDAWLDPTQERPSSEPRHRASVDARAELPPPAAAPSWPERYPRPMPTRTVTEPIKGLWVSGLVITLLTYTYSVIVASVFLSSCCGPYNSWTMYIPIVGGFIWPAMDDSYSSTVSDLMGIPGAAVQTLGVILLVIGVLARRTRVEPIYADGAPRIAPGPGDVGLGLTWDL